jgi:hypothetical protein
VYRPVVMLLLPLVSPLPYQRERGMGAPTISASYLTDF